MIGPRRPSPADAFAPPVRGRPSRPFSGEPWKRFESECRAMSRSGDWSAATPAHLVALHEDMHRRVYGVAATMNAAARKRASLFAGQRVSRDFSGDVVAAAEFVRWAWVREEEREEYRKRTNSESSFVLGYAYLFAGAKVLDEYRVSLARRAERERCAG